MAQVRNGRDGVPSPSGVGRAVGGGTPTLPGAAVGDGTPTLPARAVGGGTPTLPVRRRLDHRGPLSIDVSQAWYFITICASERIDYGRDGVPSPSGAGAAVGGGTPTLPARAVGGGTPTLPARTVGGGTPTLPARAVGGGTPTLPARTVGDGTPTLPGMFMPVANDILECARQYHLRGKWKLALFLVMPDHLHFIVRMPASDGGGTPSLPHVIQHWKHYVAEHFGLSFQKDFWDTRLRDDAHYNEKFRYICNNPVRKGLCPTAREWAHAIAFDRVTGEEREHRQDLKNED